MATNDKTPQLVERMTEDELTNLRAIRRASMAIRSCAEILNEHNVCKECSPSGPGVYICFEPNQALGIEYAIEACANRITGIFDEESPFGDIGLTDEISADLSREGEAMAEFESGAIDYETFSHRVGRGAS